MPISSNAVIHFTKSVDSIQGILTDGFKVFHCIEKLITSTGQTAFAAPMVSFCDIPLSQISEHVGKYGSYGIGLSKDWAIRRGLNPVLYLEKSSSLANHIREVILEQARKLERMHWRDVPSEIKKLLDILRYTKNHKADLERLGEVIPDYCFYDEREWRFVPSFEECPALLVPKPALDRSSTLKDYANFAISDLRLSFELSDIAYIILGTESEIAPFCKWLRNQFCEIAKDVAILQLITRIITIDRVKSDF
jgi:hypothetical protein